MAMLLTCNNAGCGHIDYHRLDEASNNVYCSKCNQVVDVSSYAKNALKSMKQVAKKVKSDFEVSCPACGAIDGPALKKFGKHTTKVVCKQCGEINEHLSRYFVEALKMRPGIEVLQATPEEIAASGLGQPTRFNRAKTPQLHVQPAEAVVVTPPSDEEVAPEVPVKVEYYTGPEKTQEVEQRGESVVVAPTTDEPINVDKKPAPKVAQRVQNIPAKKTPKVTPNEAAIRKRIENMPATVSTHVAPPPPGLSLGDFAQTGVTDYAGDVEE